MKRYRNGQSREGNKVRRLLEFEAIVDQVKRRKEAFIERLNNRLEKKGYCRLYKGNLDHKGYARLNIRFKGKIITIHAHRLFLILKIKKPIPLGFEAGHLSNCTSRRCVVHVALQHYKDNAASHL